MIKFGLVESLEFKYFQGDYSIDKETMEEAIKMLRFQEKRIETLEALNERLRMREKSMWCLEEVAKYLGVTNQTVYNMIRDNRIKAHKIGREWRFYPADIDGYIASECNVREERGYDGKTG